MPLPIPPDAPVEGAGQPGVTQRELPDDSLANDDDGFTDLEPEFLGRVEELIDFVTQP